MDARGHQAKMRGGVGFGDLVAMRIRLGEVGFYEAVEALGIVQGEAIDLSGRTQERELAAASAEGQGHKHLAVEQGPLPRPTEAGRPMRLPFWRMVSVKYFPGFTPNPDVKPFQLKPGRLTKSRRAPVGVPELGPWAELWPRLFQAISVQRSCPSVDLPKLIQRHAKAEVVESFPRLDRRTWPKRLLVIVDLAAHLIPVRADRDRVLAGLQRLLPKGGIDWVWIDEGPGGRRNQILLRTKRDLHEAVLVIGDLGCALGDEGHRVREDWALLAGDLRASGLSNLAALVPLPVERWRSTTGAQAGLAKAWGAIPWEPDSGAPATRRSAASADPAGALLQLLACAPRVEPAMLRAVRQLLPRSRADIGTELDAWSHRCITHAQAAGCHIGADALQGAHFVIAELSPAERGRLIDTLREHHRHLADELWHSTVLLLNASYRSFEGEAWEQDLNRAQDWAAYLSKRLGSKEKRAELPKVVDFLHRLETKVKGAFGGSSDSYALEFMFGELNDRQASKQDTEVPAGEALDLWQTAGGLEITTVDGAAAADRTHRPRFSYLGRILSHDGKVMITPKGRASQVWDRDQPFSPQGLRPESIRIRTDRMEATLKEVALSQTRWGEAEGIGCVDWADSLGRDRYGLWAEFQVKGIRHKMRWIPPGQFLMGTPEDEPGRSGNEIPQHLVTIPEGFWLGEVPCTQDLWEAVMGHNPSEFQTPRRPVERVSGEAVTNFVRQLNRAVLGLGASLPGEVQWEYACRAGTSEATYEGGGEILGVNNAHVLDTIAWYGGNSGHDYDLEIGAPSSTWKEVQYPSVLSGTRIVGQKVANAWGLNDMLGNVNEWCRDDFRSYESVSDRLERTSLDLFDRIGRGGSWRNHAQNVRAGCRTQFVGVYAVSNLGFRLYRGPGASGKPRAAEPRTSDRPEPERDAQAERR